MKKCWDCGQEKDSCDFNLDRSRWDGLYPRCRKCASEYHRGYRVRNLPRLKLRGRDKNLRTKYGFGQDTFNQMLAAQSGVCACCKSAPATDVDHCHKTGRVRDLLCNACNAGIGQLRDSPARCESAARYLRKFSSESEVLPFVGNSGL